MSTLSPVAPRQFLCSERFLREAMNSGEKSLNISNPMIIIVWQNSHFVLVAKAGILAIALLRGGGLLPIRGLQ